MKTQLKRWCEMPYFFLIFMAILGAAAFWNSALNFQERPKEFVGFYFCVATLVGVFLYGFFSGVGRRLLIGLYILVAIGALIFAIISPDERLETLIFGVGGAALVLVTIISHHKKEEDKGANGASPRNNIF